MAIKKKHVYNILFYGFILFLFTPYGLGTKAKLTEGVTYVKSFIFPPSETAVNERKTLDSYNVNLQGISNAENLNLEATKGKVVFINHWATWCAPCRAEMPSLQKLYDAYKDQVVFIFLTTDTKKVVDNYYISKKFSLPTYAFNSTIPKQINTTSLPATFILDKQGKVYLEEFGPADWNSSHVRNMLDVLISQ